VIASPASPQRIEWLDALRGIAIAGMVFVHVAKAAQGSGVAFDFWQSAVEFAARGKFYTIFALLFGIGFGLSPAVGSLRRLAALAIIMAAIKLIFGSSLLYYAIWGAPVILLRRLSSGWLGAIAAALLVWQSLVFGADGPPLNIVEAFLIWADSGHRGPFVLAMFLIGLMAVRHGLVRDAAAHRRLLAGIAVAGILLAAGARMLDHWWPPVAQHGFGLMRTEWLGISYATGVVLLFTGPRARRPFRPLVLVGRTSLSNYALHLVALHFMFDRWGLALSLDWRLSVPVVALVFGVMAALSAWWLRYYRQGPLEWLWRSMAEGHLAPLRRGNEAVGQPELETGAAAPAAARRR